MNSPTRFVPLSAALLAGCITATPVTDPQAAGLGQAIQNESRQFHAALNKSGAPECDYEHNMNAYGGLIRLAGRLTDRLAVAGAGPILIRAASALSSTIAHAQTSHQLASAQIDDANGACMAPGAIALNADAIDRASAAIAETQSPGGVR